MFRREIYWDSDCPVSMLDLKAIYKPMEKLKELNRAIMEREESKEAFKIYLNIMSSLEAYQYEKIEGWSRDVEQTSQAKLKLPLLVRDPETRLLKVNFDPARGR